MTNEIIPTNEEVKTLESMAKYAFESKFFKDMGFGAIFSIMLYARELGQNPMQCLFGGMHNIQGKIEISASLMNAMIRKAGHKLEILACDEKICTIKGTRSNSGETYEASFTIDEAVKAGISGRDNWKKYTSDMLFSRCLKRVARRLFSDVIGSAFVEGEISDLPAQTIQCDVTESTVKIAPDRSMDDIADELASFMLLDEPASEVSKYMTKCMEHESAPETIDEAVSLWKANPSKFIKKYNEWKEANIQLEQRLDTLLEPPVEEAS